MNITTSNKGDMMAVNRQWASRPDDERFLSLYDMQDHFAAVRNNSAAAVVSSRRIEVIPEGHTGLQVSVVGHDAFNGTYAPTHWSFGQLAQLAEAPAGYLRTLPAPMAADCINYGLLAKRDISDVGVLAYRNGGPAILRAATGPRYGRIWNADVIAALASRFGDGVNGQWKVPGEFGKPVPVTKQNTTLYASDRDCFVFLCDEEHRIEVPGRRNGENGAMARGFIVWNSEVGDKTFGLGTFLFDYICCNRIIWGMDGYEEIRIRHTASAPDKFLEEIAPALKSYSESSALGVTKAIEAAREKKVDDVDAFLAKRFGSRVVASIKAAHQLEEGRPIETLWDATTAVTAFAKSIPHQDKRVEVEREGGAILALASK